MSTFRIRYTCINFPYPLVFRTDAENEDAALDEYFTFCNECSCGNSHEVTQVEDVTNSGEEDND